MHRLKARPVVGTGSQQSDLDKRSGVAAVEFAVIAPVFVVIFLGAMSAMVQINLKHALQVLSHSAAVEYGDSDLSRTDIEKRYELLGEQLGLKDPKFSIYRRTAGEQIFVVEASIPTNVNSPFDPPGLSGTITATSYVYRDE